MSGIKHIALRCRDIEKSRQFYELLGMKFIGYRPSGSGSMDLSDGNLNMTLIRYDGANRPHLEEGTEYIHFGFIVEDAKETFLKLKKSGLNFLREDIKHRNPIKADEIPPGSFKVEDPDGNTIDVSDNPNEWRI